MTINEYQKLAMTTLNPELDERESGEAIDIVKKWLAQGHELDKEHLIKELGDIAWYLAETAYILGVDLETVLEKNIDKLRARYPEGFDTSRSVGRSE